MESKHLKQQLGHDQAVTKQQNMDFLRDANVSILLSQALLMQLTPQVPLTTQLIKRIHIAPDG